MNVTQMVLVFLYTSVFSSSLNGKAGSDMKERPRVVILGGGIGGIKAAQKLANQPVDVLIIDHNNYQVFQPLLYQVATSMLSTDEVVYPIRGFFKKRIMLISF